MANVPLTVLCGVCKERRALIAVKPHPNVTGAKVVKGFFCPKCDTLPKGSR